MSISAFKELTSQACPFMGQVETGLLDLERGMWANSMLSFNRGDQTTNVEHKIFRGVI